MTISAGASAFALSALATISFPSALPAQASPQRAGVVVRTAKRYEPAIGVIHSPEGTPLVDADIWFDDDSLHRLRPDFRGAFAWPPLSAGLHLLNVRASGYQPLIAPLNILPEKRLYAQILLYPTPPDGPTDAVEVERPIPKDTTPHH